MADSTPSPSRSVEPVADGAIRHREPHPRLRARCAGCRLQAELTRLRAVEAAAREVLTELDIIRRHREKSGVGYLVVHTDTHRDLAAALAALSQP